MTGVTIEDCVDAGVGGGREFAGFDPKPKPSPRTLSLREFTLGLPIRLAAFEFMAGFGEEKWPGDVVVRVGVSGEMKSSIGEMTDDGDFAETLGLMDEESLIFSPLMLASSAQAPSA